MRRKETGAKKACRKLKHFTDTTLDQSCKATTYKYCLCGASSKSFQLLPNEKVVQSRGKAGLKDSSLNTDNTECAAAFGHYGRSELKAITYRCCLCGASSNLFQLLPTDKVVEQRESWPKRF